MFLIVGEALSIWRKRLAFVEADAVVAHLRVCKTERADGARDRDRHLLPLTKWAAPPFIHFFLDYLFVTSSSPWWFTPTHLRYAREGRYRDIPYLDRYYNSAMDRFVSN